MDKKIIFQLSLMCADSVSRMIPVKKLLILFTTQRMNQPLSLNLSKVSTSSLVPLGLFFRRKSMMKQLKESMWLREMLGKNVKLPPQITSIEEVLTLISIFSSSKLKPRRNIISTLKSILKLDQMLDTMVF